METGADKKKTKGKNWLSKFFGAIGPGFITGAADDDPSGIGTYAQTGAIFGYSQLWLSLFSLPFMIAVQEMCGRLGLVSGKGLAAIIREHSSRSVLLIAVGLLFIANVINIGADLGAMAASAMLVVSGVPMVWWLCGFVILTILLEVFVSYPSYAQYLKYLALSLLAYIAVAFVVKIDWKSAFSATILPHFSFSSQYILNITAFLGTTISPYLFFWEADEEVEERDERKIVANNAGIGKMRLDTIIGMFFSNIISFFIIVAAAATLGAKGIHHIDTAAEAASALAPIAGKFAELLFAIGVIGIGLLAVPVLAGSVSYAVAETFSWQTGLSKKFHQARGFYGVMIAALLVGLLINFLGIPPIAMLYDSAIVNGLLAPPLLILILILSNKKSILGSRTNGRLANIFGIIITAVMTLVAVGTIVSLI